MLIVNCLGLLFFTAGALWMWGVWKADAETQARWEALFVRSKKRFRFLFPLAAVALAYAIIRDLWL